MARINRREVLAEDEVQVVHCINRCVRRGFLCGDDSVTLFCWQAPCRLAVSVVSFNRKCQRGSGGHNCGLIVLKLARFD